MTPRSGIRPLALFHGAMAVLSLLGFRIPYLAFLRAYETFHDPSIVTTQSDIRPEFVTAFLSGMGVAFAIALTLFTIASLTLCILLWRTSAYRTCRICAILLILLMPVGTIQGLVTLLALQRQSVRMEFAARTREIALSSGID